MASQLHREREAGRLSNRDLNTILSFIWDPLLKVVLAWTMNLRLFERYFKAFYYIMMSSVSRMKNRLKIYKCLMDCILHHNLTICLNLGY